MWWASVGKLSLGDHKVDAFWHHSERERVEEVDAEGRQLSVNRQAFDKQSGSGKWQITCHREVRGPIGRVPGRARGSLGRVGAVCGVLIGYLCRSAHALVHLRGCTQPLKNSRVCQLTVKCRRGSHNLVMTSTSAYYAKG